MIPSLDELASKAHAHRLVPFLGAGCSIRHLGVDWDTLTAALVEPGQPPGLSNPEIAERYVRQHGAAAFAARLRAFLHVDDFREADGTLPLQILALELRSQYTTNQDNLLEIAAAKYGRPMRAIAVLDDLGVVQPGDRLLYKFHGCLEHPESIVFTENQYEARLADEHHFMNVRLRSDLLTKSLFFVGYSFRDANIQALLRQMRQRYPDAMQGSYLVAYEWTVELEALCRDHGVTCLNPASYLDDPSGDRAEDLERFLQTLVYATASKATTEELRIFFEPPTPSPVRVAMRHQLVNLNRLAEEAPLDSATACFRIACDGAVIPGPLGKLAAGAFVTMAKRATDADLGQLRGALSNLRLSTADMHGRPDSPGHAGFAGFFGGGLIIGAVNPWMISRTLGRRLQLVSAA